MRSEGPQRLLGAARSPAAATPGLGEPPAPGQRGWTGGTRPAGSPASTCPRQERKVLGCSRRGAAWGDRGAGRSWGHPKGLGGPAGMEGSGGSRRDRAPLGPPVATVLEPLPSRCPPCCSLPCPHLSPSELVCFGLCVPALLPPLSHLLLPH